MSEKMVWMDLEMTGLDPETDRIIELAVLITDGNLNLVAEGPSIVIHQSEATLAGMDEWNTTHHGQSGLIAKVRQSQINEAQAQEAVLAFVKGHVEKRSAPLAGNSIWQDRRFIAKYMPVLDGWLHYRNVDVSTVKELAKRWYPHLPSFNKEKTHTALSDIRESIGELRYYRENIFK